MPLSLSQALTILVSVILLAILVFSIISIILAKHLYNSRKSLNKSSVNSSEQIEEIQPEKNALNQTIQTKPTNSQAISDSHSKDKDSHNSEDDSDNPPTEDSVKPEDDIKPEDKPTTSQNDTPPIKSEDSIKPEDDIKPEDKPTTSQNDTPPIKSEDSIKPEDDIKPEDKPTISQNDTPPIKPQPAESPAQSTLLDIMLSLRMFTATKIKTDIPLISQESIKKYSLNKITLPEKGKEIFFNNLNSYTPNDDVSEKEKIIHQWHAITQDFKQFCYHNYIVYKTLQELENTLTNDALTTDQANTLLQATYIIHTKLAMISQISKMFSTQISTLLQQANTLQISQEELPLSIHKTIVAIKDSYNNNPQSLKIYPHVIFDKHLIHALVEKVFYILDEEYDQHISDPQLLLRDDIYPNTDHTEHAILITERVAMQFSKTKFEEFTKVVQEKWSSLPEKSLDASEPPLQNSMNTTTECNTIHILDTPTTTMHNNPDIQRTKPSIQENIEVSPH